MTDPARWNLRRWLSESRAYTAPLPWWRFYPMALAKWPAFNRQQRRDAVEMAAAAGAQWSEPTGGTDAV